MIGLEILFTAHAKELKSKDDAVVLFVHCFLINNGFQCVATANDKPSELLPNGWNSASGSYVLNYKSKEKNILLKVLRIDNNLLVNFLQTPGDLTATADVNSDAYFTSNFANYNSAFINDTSASSLEDILKKTLSELKPPQAPVRSQPSLQQNPPPPPLRVDPGRGCYQPRVAPPYGMPSHFPTVGGADLDPLQRGRGGGMILGPEGFPDYSQNRRDRGGPYGLPPGAVPPGAKFDPFGPPGITRPGKRTPGGPGANRAEPNPDNMRPPDDYDDMFM